jgi:hypothetical protein
MTRALVLLGLSAALGFGAFWAGTRTETPTCGEAPQCHTDLDWLKREYSLSDEVSARVRDLHEAYNPGCEALCARVLENRKHIDKLASGGEGYSPELDAALREAANLRFASQRLYLQHAHAVAAAMPPEQGQRYLAMMRGRIFEHCVCKSGMCPH